MPFEANQCFLLLSEQKKRKQDPSSDAEFSARTSEDYVSFFVVFFIAQSFSISADIKRIVQLYLLTCEIHCKCIAAYIFSKSAF